MQLSLSWCECRKICINSIPPEIHLLVIVVCINVLMSDDLSPGEITRVEFVLLTLQVLHFCVCIWLPVINLPLWILYWPEASQSRVRAREKNTDSERKRATNPLHSYSVSLCTSCGCRLQLLQFLDFHEKFCQTSQSSTFAWTVSRVKRSLLPLTSLEKPDNGDSAAWHSVTQPLH